MIAQDREKVNLLPPQAGKTWPWNVAVGYVPPETQAFLSMWTWKVF